MKPKIFFERKTITNVEIVKISGFMDISQTPQFEKYLDDLLQAGSIKFVLDLTDLDYISSSSLGVMIGRIHELRKRGGDIKVGGCSPRIKDILEAFGFPKIFTFKNTAEEALQAFSG
jgi:anti-anti-sigma factor